MKLGVTPHSLKRVVPRPFAVLGEKSVVQALQTLEERRVSCPFSDALQPAWNGHHAVDILGQRRRVNRATLTVLSGTSYTDVGAGGKWGRVGTSRPVACSPGPNAEPNICEPRCRRPDPHTNSEAIRSHTNRANGNAHVNAGLTALSTCIDRPSPSRQKSITSERLRTSTS